MELVKIKAQCRQHTAAVIFDLKKHGCSLIALCTLHGRKYAENSADLMCFGWDFFHGLPSNDGKAERYGV